MTTRVLVAPATYPVGTRLQTEYGNYEVDSDGLVTVDVRLSAQLINNGFSPQVAAADVSSDISERLVPAGGTTGQQLSKAGDEDYNMDWAAAS